jgi:hypothetical protein
MEAESRERRPGEGPSGWLDAVLAVEYAPTIVTGE